MLNRKLSEYLFYAVLVAILLIVFLVRQFTLGNINSKIDTVSSENIKLNKQIDTLEELVEENKDKQSDHLYELYNNIPNYYSYDELYFDLLAELYEIGVDDSEEFSASITMNSDLETTGIAQYEELSNGYKMVLVNISFNTDDIEKIETLIDNIYNSDQIFLINSLEYSNPDGENYVSVIVTLYSYYEMNE